MDSSFIGNWIFIPDRPIDLKGDLLWKDDNIHEKLQQIAERIIGPLHEDSSKYFFHLSHTMTFAIYGSWGMGKSSAMKMLKEKALIIAEREGVSERFRICEYVASAYAPFALDARVTLAQRVFTALSGSDSRAIQQMLEQVNAYRDDGIGLYGQDKHITARNSYFLRNIATELSQLTDFDKILEEKMLGSGRKSYVLAVLIDDLDRCTTTFIWQILNFIQQLSDVPNLFFVLAVEQNHLRTTIEELLTRKGKDNTDAAFNTDLALEKYIQHDVTVPDMSEDSLSSFMYELMSKYEEGDYVAQAVVENIDIFKHVLQTKKGTLPLTPRFVKRFLNTIRSELANNLRIADTHYKRRKVVKEELLKFTWPVFHQTCFLPTRPQSGEQNRNLFGYLEWICSSYREASDKTESLSWSKQLLEPYNQPFITYNGSINLKLVEFLGMEPYWCMRQSSLVKIHLQQLGRDRADIDGKENIDENDIGVSLIRDFESNSADKKSNLEDK